MQRRRVLDSINSRTGVSPERLSDELVNCITNSYSGRRAKVRSGERTRPRVLAMTSSSSRTFLLPATRPPLPWKFVAARAPQPAREGACAPRKQRSRYHASVCARCSICSRLGSVLLIQFRAWLISVGLTGIARGISSPLATKAPSYFTGLPRLMGNFQ